MYSVSKKFGPYPFAHRQWSHSGHCKHIHGHNWYFDITFQGPEESFDSNGFLIDFGKLKDLHVIFEQKFDHTLVVRADDPLLSRFLDLQTLEALRLIPIPNASSEGLAAYIFNLSQAWLNDLGFLAQHIVTTLVVVSESERNSASYALPYPLSIY